MSLLSKGAEIILGLRIVFLYRNYGILWQEECMGEGEDSKKEEALEEKGTRGIQQAASHRSCTDPPDGRTPALSNKQKQSHEQQKARYLLHQELL